MAKKKVIDLLTIEELMRVQELKRCIVSSSSNLEIHYYRKEFDDIINMAKVRYSKQ